MIDTDMAEQILQGDDTHPDILQALGLEILDEVERLRSIADDLYTYIVSDADISLSTIEEQMDWREEI